jgi:presenilin-like A22 family membrane protease
VFFGLQGHVPRPVQVVLQLQFRHFWFQQALVIFILGGGVDDLKGVEFDLLEVFCVAILLVAYVSQSY